MTRKTSLKRGLIAFRVDEAEDNLFSAERSQWLWAG